jgi:hypothetical protein
VAELLGATVDDGAGVGVGAGSPGSAETSAWFRLSLVPMRRKTYPPDDQQ